MSKAVKTWYILLLVVLVILPVPFFTMFKSRFDTENYEMRTLAPMPEISAANIENIPSGFESWFNDHLPFRNQLLTLNGRIDYDLLHSSTSESVIIGKDGWLFYKGAQANHEDPVSDYMGTNLFTQEELERIRENMLAARDELASRECRFIIYIAPNKERVYSEYMPAAYGEPAENCRMNQVVDYLRETTDIPVICCYDDIMAYRRAHPDEEIYFKYDTHWNELGAYIGSLELVRELGFELPSPEDVTKQDMGQGTFDLARLIHLGNTLKYDYAPYLQDYSEHEVIGENNEQHTEYRFYNPENDADHQKLFVIGDSFSSFLAPYLVCHYNNAYVNFYYNYKYRQLDEENAQVVVYETVERYLGNMLTFSLYSGIGKN